MMVFLIRIFIFVLIFYFIRKFIQRFLILGRGTDASKGNPRFEHFNRNDRFERRDPYSRNANSRFDKGMDKDRENIVEAEYRVINEKKPT